MSFLNKIRKNTWLIFFIIGISLIFFILDPNFITKFFKNDSELIGKVNGDNIYKKDYENCIIFLKKFRGYSENNAWKILVNEKLLNQQAKKIGIDSTEKDFWKTMETQSIYSNIDDFQNENGKLDLEKFKFYINSLYKYPNNIFEKIEKEKNIWTYEENRIKNKIFAKKYIEMLMYGLNISEKEVKINCNNKKSFSIIDYIYIPYSEIKKKYNVSVSKNDIHNYINKNLFLFKKENLRDLNFIILRSTPSSEDDQKMNSNMNLLFNRLKYINKYSDFFSNTSEKPFDYKFYTKDNLPSILKYFLEKKNKIGSMFGPLKIGNLYIVAKLTGKKIIFDYVLISHILISHNKAIHSLNKRKKEDAIKISKDIYSKLLKNPKKFNFFLKKSDDLSNKKKGNLGWIKYNGNDFIGNFDIFSNKNKTGTIGLINTEFGYHIVKIDSKKNIKNAYQFGVIIKTLNPSIKTKNDIYKKMVSFYMKNKNYNLDKLIRNAKKNNFETLLIKDVKDNKWFDIEGFNYELNKKIINWTFEKKRKKGDTKIFKNINKDYILVYLSNIKKNEINSYKMNKLITFLMKNKIYNILYKKFHNKNMKKISSYFLKKVNKSRKVNFYDSFLDNKNEPKVIGSAFSLKLDKISNPILGRKGIFFIKVKKRFIDNNKLYCSNLESEINNSNSDLRKNILEKLENVLLEKSNIECYK
ncbi:SurA N-terminal domain-containing protein [Blattabacterium cuenoti]|uniref:SurA N-terminal domain-containing protein n=1 Tax=Blattabacterium cuenoti TaxID=1653831 RepID=UPI00163B790D|nr:SurA N-terminal domain-containing protein [Blattabacterium cuenoti]